MRQHFMYIMMAKIVTTSTADRGVEKLNHSYAAYSHVRLLSHCQKGWHFLKEKKLNMQQPYDVANALLAYFPEK